MLAIIVCKLLHWIGKRMGKGSSLPGRYALKLCPDVLGRVRLPERIVAVTGSNGKTSTVEMIAAVLRARGLDVVYNAEGSNQIEGAATLILCHCTLGGRMRGDVLLLESDERYARVTFRYFHPTYFVITNLYRDQLSRNGHSEWVYDSLLPAVHPDTTLLLNADDPLVSCFAIGHPKVRWFGLEECAVSGKEHRGVYNDGTYCPVCKGRMDYRCYHYAHMGYYRCTQCGHSRAAADYAATAVDLEKGTLTLDGQVTVSLRFCSIYNVYNILAAYAACRECGVSPEDAAAVLSGYLLKNGRRVCFTLGSHPGTLLTSKHENSVAYDTNLRYIARQGGRCTVMVIVDAISRKYYTGETSWLWDIDFDQLACPHVERVCLCGRYVDDLALRFAYTKVPKEKLLCYRSIAEAAEQLRQSGEEPLYVVTCFSDRDKLLRLTQVQDQ